MERVINVMEEDVKYNHLPLFRRVGLFFYKRKWRFIFAAALYGGFRYWGNGMGLIGSKIERTFKKYKKRWIFRYNPTCMAHQSAIDTMYTPAALSRQSTDLVSEMFVKVDREMEYGVSRQLIIDTL